MTQPIFLVGPRGCGKTTVGLELARVCHRQFVDTDHWLQTEAGKTIADIVEQAVWLGEISRTRNGRAESGHDPVRGDRHRRWHCSGGV